MLESQVIWEALHLLVTHDRRTMEDKKASSVAKARAKARSEEAQRVIGMLNADVALPDDEFALLV